MSRSYKKHPVVKCAPVKAVWEKRQANRTFRRRARDGSVRGKSAIHRKFYESWNIHDYIFYETWSEARRDWEIEERMISFGTVPSKYVCRAHYFYKDLNSYKSYWKKTMYGK